jgi:hypothetical protein
MLLVRRITLEPMDPSSTLLAVLYELGLVVAESTVEGEGADG